MIVGMMPPKLVQMMLNKGTLSGHTIIKPESVAMMSENHIGDLGIYSDGTAANPGRPGQKFGLDFAVYVDPAAGQNPFGKGTYYWGGAAGTWFWIDPTNDIVAVGMIQRMGGTGGDDLGTMARTLTYQALLHPEK